MKTYQTPIRLIVFLMLFSGIKAHAQLDGLLKKAKEKGGEIIEKKGGAKKTGYHIKDTGNFITGDSLIFSEDFSGTKNGAQSRFKGTVNVETVQGNSGKWLSLQNKTTYKFSKAIIYPRQFTVEFDVLTTGEKIKDISPMSFGFATDNSAGEYTSNAGAYVELHYYDGDQVNFGNSSPKKFINTTFDLSAYLNRPLHVALAVDGQRIAVYLDGKKLQDAVFFNPSVAKNFYFTAPWTYENGAKVLISNIKIYGFKK
ncbi:hypothetical protein [uncultured Sphingobacterium sp.]|uniref:hypothetical protein n=1 Tax=uncultured Sphingobacterium sp. TaxID=182688 RepID=UPI0037486C22